MTFRIINSFLAAMFLTGCATVKPPSSLSEYNVAEILRDVEWKHPTEKLYRQYVSGKLYLQLDRISEKNVIYGWLTCTDCVWTREKMAAVYDGSYLYLTYGRHEDFFVQNDSLLAGDKPALTYLSPEQFVQMMLTDMHPDKTHWLTDWKWNTVEKYRVEGRNLVLLSQFRKCVWDNDTGVQEYTNAPLRPDFDEIDCRYQEPGKYNTIYVATIDETLVGKLDSIVGSERGNVKERLEALKKLYEDGTIDESEYRTKRKDILDEL